MRVGVISDTHGLLRPEATAALGGVDHILHAGDVGDPAILDTLAAIAPLTAIRGNIDRSGVCAALPPTEMVDFSGSTIYMLHSLHDLDLDPVAGRIAIVVSGHSHQAYHRAPQGRAVSEPRKRRPETILAAGLDWIPAVRRRWTSR